MIAGAAWLGALALVLVPASASAGAGTGAARPSVALTASPSHIELTGAAAAVVRVTNTGAARVVVDVTRAGFALDLRGRPRIVASSGVRRSAASWIVFRPRSIALRPGGSASVRLASKLPARAEPGDHDALVLFTTRRRAQDGVAVRMRMGVVVVVRAPGPIVRRLRVQGLGVLHLGRMRVLEVLVANLGNVTQTIGRAEVSMSLERGGRRVGKPAPEPRELRPGTRGVLRFRYAGRVRGWVSARIAITVEPGRIVQRTFRVRL